MNEIINIPGTSYIVTSDLKIINSKTNKENSCINISVLMDDGIRHCFRRERLIYAAKNNINPLYIPKDIVINNGAEMIVAIAGEILRMPGLPKEPQALHIDIVDGEIEGLS